MTSEERNAFARREAGSSQAEFYLLSESERLLLGQITKGYRALALGLQPHDNFTEQARLSPLHVFEASALCVQMQAVWSVIGAEAAGRFTSCIMEESVLSDYARILRALAKVCITKGVAISPPVFESVLCWSLIGSIQRDGAMGTPEVRCSRLVAALIKGELQLPMTGLYAAAWRQWDDHFTVAPLQQTIADCREFDRRMIAEVVRVAPSLVNGDAILDAARCYTQVADSLRKRVSNSPESYACVGPYLRDDSFPIPRMRLEFFGGWAPVFERGVAEKLFRVRRCKPLSDNQIGLEEVWVRQKRPAGRSPEFSEESVVLADESFRLCDYCFMESRRSDSDLQQGAAILEEIGVQTFEII